MTTVPVLIQPNLRVVTAHERISAANFCRLVYSTSLGLALELLHILALLHYPETTTGDTAPMWYVLQKAASTHCT